MSTPNNEDNAAGRGRHGLASPIKYFGYLVNISAVAGTALIAVVMVILNADILSRAVFSRALPGVREIVTASLALIVFLQLSSALRNGRMVKTDGVVPLLKIKLPVAARVLEMVHLLVGVGMFAVLSYATWNLLLSAYASSDQYGVPGGFSFAKWPVQAVVFFGCVLMALQYLTLAISAGLSVGGRSGQEPQGGESG